jgi:signal transduction histidine kinase/ABC-type multidrug transport system ATPase subunit
VHVTALTASLATAPPPPQLSVAGLTVRFGSLMALNQVSLDVRAGELVALAGENGAGKTTLLRCIGGDIGPLSGAIRLDGKLVPSDPIAAKRQKINVVWQDLALCDNLDIASNVMLGRERRRHLLSDIHLHTDAARLFQRLGVPLRDTTRSVRSLSGGQRQLVAVARAMADSPRLLLLDEPTSSLGVQESALVEELITRLREQGTTILLACHDIGQMFRLADRIVVLRHGRLTAEVAPTEVHPDDVAALVSGQEVDSSARRQLTRLHGLAGRLVSSDPGSSLSLILSALGAALGSERLCIHLPVGTSLICEASLGLPAELQAAWSRLPWGPAGGPVGLAGSTGRVVIADNIRAGDSWAIFGDLARVAKVASSWSVPVLGSGGLLGVITVFRGITGRPHRDDLDLATLYASYAASAIERDRLLEQVTARNRVLETIREMLQTLAGPVPVGDGLGIALQALRRGLQADQVALVVRKPGGSLACRALAGSHRSEPEAVSAARSVLAGDHRDGIAIRGVSVDGERLVSVSFAVPGGRSVLVARWRHRPPAADATDLLEDAAHSLRLALEREEAWSAHQEAMTLRRSQELQRGFLRRLSHELRTPLTAITGYASSLLQPDVTWDAESQYRFLSRIAAESSRLGRLVNDLLDFSAIESGILRLQSDWCDIPLVLDAALACLPQATAPLVEVRCDPDLPAIWADHDRLEQVFVNLLSNAFGHNPPGTRVTVTATPDTTAPDTAGAVTVKVADDGTGMPADLEVVRKQRTSSSGAGLGLSIASGIVAAHGGQIELEKAVRGTCFRISLPVEMPAGEPPEIAPEITAEMPVIGATPGTAKPT